MSSGPKGPIFLRTAEDHMEHLEKIFEALQVADLKIKVSKCEFFKKHVSYLGFLIGETGIHYDRSKVEAMNKIATPTSIEEVCQFNECVRIIRNLYRTIVTLVSVLMT